MIFETEGRIVVILPETSGEGKNGKWIRQDFVVDTREQFSKKMCFSAWNDKADVLKTLHPGEDVKISFSVESREYNSRWYTDMRIWRLDKVGVGNQTSSQPQNIQTTNTNKATEENDMLSSSQNDDLPF